MMASPSKAKVYRLRNLPGHVDRQLAAELFASCMTEASPQHISIASLAYAVDAWTRVKTKTATLVFQNSELEARLSAAESEWTFKLPSLVNPLILDHHFRGLTSLNDVDSGEHQYE